MSEIEGASDQACPVCGRTDAYPIRHGLMSNRGFGLQDDGSWASGRCMGSPPEEWHCRGCGCEWPTSGYRFHCFIDVVAPDHETARRAVEARVFGGAVPDGVEVDPGLIGDAVGHLGTDGDEDRWTWD